VLKIIPAKLCDKHLALSDIGERHAKQIVKQAFDAAREQYRHRRNVPTTPTSERAADRHRGRRNRVEKRLTKMASERTQ
jgi:hypothetical protein